MRFLALDFETGGLAVEERAPVTLGLAIFENGEVVRSREWLFKPIRSWDGSLRFAYSEDAARIHGKSLALMDAEGLDLERIYDEVQEFLGGQWSSPLVSHNAPFDGEVWSNFLFALARYDGENKVTIPKQELLTGPWFCTRRLAQSIPDFVPNVVRNLRLSTLCEYYGLGEQGALHGAEQDAVLAGRLFVALRGVGE